MKFLTLDSEVINSMSDATWFQQNYLELQKSYAGQWILVSGTEVLFADPKYEKVYKKYLEYKGKKICEIMLIDNGESTQLIR